MSSRADMLDKALQKAEDNCRHTELQKEQVEDFSKLVKHLEQQKPEGRSYRNIRKFLTEKMYHNLCETPLGTQDVLGMVLGEMLELQFKERQPNSFVYSLDSGWTAEVPTYSDNCIKLIVDNDFLKQDIREDFEFKLALGDRDRTVKKLAKWRAYQNASDMQKSEIVYSGLKEHPVYRLLLFKAGNITGKFDRSAKEILEDCERIYRQNTEILQRIYDGYAERYKEQAKQLRKYSGLLLGWTSRILVYRACDKGYSSMNCMTIQTLSDIPREAIVPHLSSLTEKG